MRKCPFAKFKECRTDCELYREEGRVDDVTGQHQLVKGCALAMLADHMINANKRAAMTQAEMGEVKNAAVFHALAALTDAAEAKDELKRIVVNSFKVKQLEH